jgi:hypothetical protein
VTAGCSPPPNRNSSGSSTGFFCREIQGSITPGSPRDHPGIRDHRGTPKSLREHLGVTSGCRIAPGPRDPGITAGPWDHSRNTAESLRDAGSTRDPGIRNHPGTQESPRDRPGITPGSGITAGPRDHSGNTSESLRDAGSPRILSHFGSVRIKWTFITLSQLLPCTHGNAV